MRARSLVLVVAALVAACGDAVDARDAYGQRIDGDSFHEWFQALVRRADRGDESWEAVHAGSLAALPFTRIAMHRSMAAYTVFEDLDIAFADGERATRRGYAEDWPSTGGATLVADVPFHEVARLCWLIETLDLPRRSQSWSVAVSHGEHVTLSWTDREDRTVTLEDYGAGAPPAVRALVEAIENTARRLTWSAGDADGGAARSPEPAAAATPPGPESAPDDR